MSARRPRLVCLLALAALSLTAASPTAQSPRGAPASPAPPLAPVAPLAQAPQAPPAAAPAAPLAPAPAAPCAPESVRALGEAAALRDGGDPLEAERTLLPVARADAACRGVAVAFWALFGANSAAHAATRGGSAEALGPVTSAVEVMQTLASDDGPTSAAEYAKAALLAAAAAAQDERDEMRLWLAHARAVALRLAALGDAPAWPAPVDLVEGTLWFEVDRFEDAAGAYERAATARPSVAAWLGLGRARERLGRREGACAAYRAASVAAAQGRPSTAVRDELARHQTACGR